LEERCTFAYRYISFVEIAIDDNISRASIIDIKLGIDS